MTDVTMEPADQQEYTVATDTEISREIRDSKNGKVAFGFDLGTAFSTAAVWKQGNVEIVQTDSHYQLPSYVTFGEEDEAMGAGGSVTQEQLCSGEVYFCAKRLIGRTDLDPVVAKGKFMWPFFVHTIGLGLKPSIGVMRKGVWRFASPEEILAIVLLEMKSFTEAQTGRICRNVVLSMPASFNRYQQARMQRACGLAGLNALRIMPEPSAVTLIYAQQQQQQDFNSGVNLGSGAEKNVLVFNLGAGYCDIAVAATAGGFCQVKALAGDAIGGEDIVAGMMRHILDDIASSGKAPIIEDRRNLGNLRMRCVEAMQKLSNEMEATVCVSFSDGTTETSETRQITRTDFDRWNQPFYERCLELVNQALSDAKVEAGYLDDYILVGGCSAIPELRSMLRKLFGGKAPYNLKLKPGQEVAYGTALEAAITSGIKDPSGSLDLLTIQAIPFSIGIGISGGHVFRVISRNSTIPVRKEVIVSTSHDDQTEALISVYEGEEANASESHLLGLFLLSGIPPLPKGVPIISASMDIDAMDTLRVIAGVYLPNQKEPAVPLMEIRMPSVDEAHGWCMEAVEKKFGTSRDVVLPSRV